MFPSCSRLYLHPSPPLERPTRVLKRVTRATLESKTLSVRSPWSEFRRPLAAAVGPENQKTSRNWFHSAQPAVLLSLAFSPSQLLSSSRIYRTPAPILIAPSTPFVRSFEPADVLVFSAKGNGFSGADGVNSFVEVPSARGMLARLRDIRRGEVETLGWSVLFL